MKKILILSLITLISIPLLNCGKKEKSSDNFIKTSSGIEMALIPGGKFIMGGDGDDNSPAREVEISPFYMDRYEVTQGMYKKLELPDASHFKGDSNPAEMVAWINAAIYCNERSIEEGLTPCYDEKTWECDFSANGYRLPTEAEWEYAARGGTKGKHFFGNDQRLLKNYAIYKSNSGNRTSSVGTRKPNPRGLYDMYGNVAEWCNDFYSKDYYSNAPSKDPRGPEKGKARVIRGGSWADDESRISSEARGFDDSINDACILRDTIGFRAVRKAD
jgi:formylglycine-generating enzyme required for sulfatase activity